MRPATGSSCWPGNCREDLQVSAATGARVAGAADEDRGREAGDAAEQAGGADCAGPGADRRGASGGNGAGHDAPSERAGLAAIRVVSVTRPKRAGIAEGSPGAVRGADGGTAEEAVEGSQRCPGARKITGAALGSVDLPERS